jgi:heptaprenyl diphosphate synthase
MKVYKMTLTAFLTALAFVLHYVEAFIPLSFLTYAVPGFRIGLANMVGLFALFYLGPWYYVGITVVRIVLVGAAVTGFSTAFLLSCGGALFSIVATLLCYYLTKVSVYGISAVGAFFHVLGQILVYIWIIQTPYMLLYFPALAAISMASGVLLGILVAQILRVIPPIEKIAGVKRNPKA